MDRTRVWIKTPWQSPPPWSPAMPKTTATHRHILPPEIQVRSRPMLLSPSKIWRLGPCSWNGYRECTRILYVVSLRRMQSKFQYPTKHTAWWRKWDNLAISNPTVPCCCWKMKYLTLAIVIFYLRTTDYHMLLLFEWYPLPWASVHWLVQCTLECHWNATGWPIVHWNTTGRPSEYLQGTLEHHWKT